MSSRVFIWDASVVAPSGNSLEEVFSSIGSARRCTGPIRNFDDANYPKGAVGEVGQPDRVERLPPGADRKSVFLERAAEHIAKSGIVKLFAPEEIDFFLGLGPDHYNLPGHAESGDRSPTGFRKAIVDSLPLMKKIAETHGFKGRLLANVTACTASSQALGLGFRNLKRTPPGQKKLVIAGGADSMLNPAYFMGFHRLGALSALTDDPSRAARPFDRNRSGVVLGEGAALFALGGGLPNRKVMPLAEIAGYASSMDAHMITDPEPTGQRLAEAALRALKEAGVSPSEVDSAHLHGTSTHKSDRAEAAALERIFGPRFKELPVYSMKGQIGHASSACGSIEMLAVLFSLATDSVPPTVNFENTDPEVPLFVIKGRPHPARMRTILKLNSAFGGQNTALVVRRYEP